MNAFRKRLFDSKAYKWWSFCAIALGTFASVADFGLLIVSLPTISEYFRIDLPTGQWIMIGYALTIGALLLPMGRLADMIGRRRVFVIGFGLFAVAGLCAGLSESVGTLIFFKVLQGIGASMTQGTAMAMAVSAFPKEERGQALGLHVTIVGLGNVAGPALGGFIVGEFGWRWIFYFSVTMSILAIVTAMAILDPQKFSIKNKSRDSFDWIGAALSTISLVALLLVMTAGPLYGWLEIRVGFGLLILVIAITAFVRHELRIEAPMIDVLIFKKKLVSLGVVAQIIAFIGNSSIRFLLPFYLQVVRGYSPQFMGLIFVPGAASMIIAGPVSGRLSDKFGWRKFTVGGLLLSSVGIFILSNLSQSSSLYMIIVGLTLPMAGISVFYPANSSSILSSVSDEQYGVVSGLVNLVRNAGNITGVAVATVIVTGVMGSMGVAPSLSAISADDGGRIFMVFMKGLQMSYKIIGCLVILAAVLSYIRGRNIGSSN